jgi:hypothetical protein
MPFLANGTPYEDCPSCGYVQLDADRLPSREAEKARYLLHDNTFEDPGYRGFIMEFLRVATPYIKPGGEVLDFGSGPLPVPAALLSAQGFEVTVYDPLFAPARGWDARSWDAIVVHEVAEHLAQPGMEFARLAERLVPGGVLCVRTRFLPEQREKFASWHYRADMTHVGFFSARSATALACRLGLAIALVEDPDRIILSKP